MSELFDKSIRTLELPAVLKMLADQASSAEAKEKALALARLGAELGYPNWQEQYAILIEKEDRRIREALDLYFAAAKQGQLSSWY